MKRFLAPVTYVFVGVAAILISSCPQMRLTCPPSLSPRRHLAPVTVTCRCLVLPNTDRRLVLPNTLRRLALPNTLHRLELPNTKERWAALLRLSIQAVAAPPHLM
jgi:hypothetical protein